jgi:hypothetical protein
MEVKANVAYEADFAVERATWSRRGKGLAGFEARHWLRGLAPDERQEEIDTLCGADAGSTEVLVAEIPNLDDFADDYRLDCGIERAFAHDPDLASIRVSIHGPWVAPLPDLGTEPLRHHPVVFRFPRVDYAETRFHAPPGFVPGPLPATTKLDSPFGRFVLQVEDQGGVLVAHRFLALTAIVVRVEDFDALRGFLDSVRLADRTQISFERAAGS